MASDDMTSQDSIVIGDDLVEALGFEPIVHDDASASVVDDVQASSIDADFPSVELLSSIEATDSKPHDRASHEAEAVLEMAIDEIVETDGLEATSDGVSVDQRDPEPPSTNGVIDLSDGEATRRTVFGRFASRQRSTVTPDPTDPVVFEPVVFEPVVFEPVVFEPVVLEPDAAGSGERLLSQSDSQDRAPAEDDTRDSVGDDHSTEFADAPEAPPAPDLDASTLAMPPPPTMDDLITFVATDDAEFAATEVDNGVQAEPIVFEPIEIPRYEFPDLVVSDVAGAQVDVEATEPVAILASETLVDDGIGADVWLGDEAEVPEAVADEEAAASVVVLPEVPVAPPVIDLPRIEATTIDLDRIDLPSEVPPAPLPVDAPVDAVISSPAATLTTRRQRLRARKTRRVIRHIDPWSALKFSIIFHLCFFAALLLASVLVWNAAVAAGTIENIESFIRELGDYEKFEIDSNKVFTAAMLIAGMLTLASTIMVVLLTVVFNLISDLVGGIRVTVIEEDTVRVADLN